MALGCALIFGFLDRNVAMGFAAFIGAGLLVAAFLPNLERASVTLQGIEVQARKVVDEARATVDELRGLAVLTATVSLSLVKRTGRIGGYTHEQETQIVGDTIALLDRLGVSPEERDAVFAEWHQIVEKDYAMFALGGTQSPEGAAERPDMRAEWDELRRRPTSSAATPDEVEAFLRKWGYDTDERLEIVEDYRWYVAHREHRRPELWANRLKIWLSAGLSAKCG